MLGKLLLKYIVLLKHNFILTWHYESIVHGNEDVVVRRRWSRNLCKSEIVQFGTIHLTNEWRRSNQTNRSYDEMLHSMGLRACTCARRLLARIIKRIMSEFYIMLKEPNWIISK